MSKYYEIALKTVIRARGFEDEMTIRFAKILEGNHLTDHEAMVMATQIAKMPFDDEEE